MECLCYLLQVISFKSFEVCAFFVKGMSSECDDFCLLFFITFWKWRALQRFQKKDELVEKIGDARIKEEGILEVRLSFAFVLSRLCVMKSVKIN
jgi:hypothetical protein